jgi:hypothetical protein
VCDPIAPLFFTTEATNQAWFPEWIQNGFWGTDSDIAGRAYDQRQWAHAFGPSSIPYPAPLRYSQNWNAYWDIAGKNGTYDQAVAAGIEFSLLRTYMETIEATGPKLTTKSFLRTLYSSPPLKARKNPFGGWLIRASFGKGPGKVGPYSAIDDFMEVWWDPNRKSPAGDTGYLYYVDEGKRHLVGDWPKGPPNVFVNDHSPQPGPDPQAQCKCHK